MEASTNDEVKKGTNVKDLMTLVNFSQQKVECLFIARDDVCS